MPILTPILTPRPSPTPHAPTTSPSVLCCQALRGQLSRDELATVHVPKHLGNLERLLGVHGGLWFTGDFSLADLRVADLCLHLFVPSLPGCLDSFPRLSRMVARVVARPRIAAYLASERYAQTDKFRPLAA